MERGLSEKNAGYLEKWNLGATNTYRGKASKKNNSSHLLSEHVYSYSSPVALQPFVGTWPLLQFRSVFYTVGLLGLGISLSQGRYLHTEQHNT
jgi:hypothetical protein